MLLAEGAKLVVACNSATAAAAGVVRERLAGRSGRWRWSESPAWPPRSSARDPAGSEIDALVVDCVERVCAPLRAAAVDTVVLGCTHYPLVRSILQRTLGRGVEIVTSGAAIAEEVERELRARGLGRPESRRGSYRLKCSGDPEAFRRLGTRFLRLPLGEVRHVDVASAGRDDAREASRPRRAAA